MARMIITPNTITAIIAPEPERGTEREGQRHRERQLDFFLHSMHFSLNHSLTLKQPYTLSVAFLGSCCCDTPDTGRVIGLGSPNQFIGELARGYGQGRW